MSQQYEGSCGTLLIRTSAVIGILACLGDPIMITLLGIWYPDYKPFLQAMSDLGHAGSPVAHIASAGWIIMGLMFVIFGYGFYRAFLPHAKMARTAGWMLALYGIGEGLGSGLIPGSPGKTFQTPSSIFHNLLGAVGVSAAILLPFIIIKMFNVRKSSALFWYSWFATVTGLLFFILFSISNFYHPEGNCISDLGLWQRLFMLTYYLFFICLAVLMLSIKNQFGRCPVGRL
jgi:hypothetical membrane protein